MTCGHLVMARFLSSNVPRGYGVDEGPSWFEALTARFKRYEERSRAVGVSELEQRSFTALVGRHMLKVKPEEREPAPGCMERGDFCGCREYKYDTEYDVIEQDDYRRKSRPGQKMVE